MFDFKTRSGSISIITLINIFLAIINLPFCGQNLQTRYKIRETYTAMKYFQQISVKYLGLVRLVADKDKEISQILIDTLTTSAVHLVDS